MLGRREAVEQWPTPRRRTYLHPFVERARALVREDEEGLARAAAGFEAFGLTGTRRERVPAPSSAGAI